MDPTTEKIGMTARPYASRSTIYEDEETGTRWKLTAPSAADRTRIYAEAMRLLQDLSIDDRSRCGLAACGSPGADPVTSLNTLPWAMMARLSVCAAATDADGDVLPIGDLFDDPLSEDLITRVDRRLRMHWRMFRDSLTRKDVGSVPDGS